MPKLFNVSAVAFYQIKHCRLKPVEQNHEKEQEIWMVADFSGVFLC